MSDSPVDLVWVEKYRPKSLDHIALDPQTRNLIAAFLEKSDIPHLLLSGPPGCGKTTVARLLIASLKWDVMSLNASKDRGIEIIRDRVGTFAKSLGFHAKKVVFFDEADGLTPDAQNSLRNLMEEYAEQTRFIFTANSPHKIISPVQSRCTQIAFGETPLKERILILQNILDSEKVRSDLGTILGYANKYHDLRRMIFAAHKSVLSNNGVLGPASETLFLGIDLVTAILEDNWNSIVAAASNPSFDHRKGLVDMFWAVDDKKIKKASTWRYKLANAVHQSQWTPDPVVHFLGACAELLEYR